MSGTPDSPSTTKLLRTFRWDDLSPDERQVLLALRNRQGRAAAISVQDMAFLVGLNPRRCQEVVKDLTEKHGIPVGSTSSSTSPGWWLCVNDEERQATRDSLQSRGLSILRRAKAFGPNNQARLAELFGAQEPLLFGVRREE